MGSKSQPAHSRGFLLCAAHSRGPVRGAILVGWALRTRGISVCWILCARTHLPVGLLVSGAALPIGPRVRGAAPPIGLRVRGAALPIGPRVRRAGSRDGLPCHFVPDGSCERGEILLICGERKVPIASFLGSRLRDFGPPFEPWDAPDALRGVSGRASGQADAAFGPPEWVLGPRLRVLCELKEGRSATGGEAK